MNMSKPPVPTQRTMKRTERDSREMADAVTFSECLRDNGVRAKDSPEALSELLKEQPTAMNWQAFHNILVGTLGDEA
ncbi:hypothetical protein UFOVP380_50 [uncultured Caudovirales phage]|uniref:Uncharacterized protein n=1 Tax=uncultured Caudovirales phage TaxID=2100421 RepID=A0A6J7X342_9CAUD|nr:hypothetical protein UFOVP380_50 [uncultured Caudovirales phage]